MDTVRLEGKVAIVAGSIFAALPGVGSAASPAPRRTDVAAVCRSCRGRGRTPG
ncbi:MAG: hypothetical protein IIA72_02285 [Proteobacteria bacterium]|nr:hypothetical protein [Pseudomonadota bacterium]